jgi:hypothetical protein
MSRTFTSVEMVWVFGYEEVELQPERRTSSQTAIDDIHLIEDANVVAECAKAIARTEQEESEKTMDPNANLDEMLQLARLIDVGEDSWVPEQAERLAELVVAMDGWLRKGGFRPARWDTVRATEQATR